MAFAVTSLPDFKQVNRDQIINKVVLGGRFISRITKQTGVKKDALINLLDTDPQFQNGAVCRTQSIQLSTTEHCFLTKENTGVFAAGCSVGQMIHLQDRNTSFLLQTSRNGIMSIRFWWMTRSTPMGMMEHARILFLLGPMQTADCC